jgi:L-seryl-tRNA(Ser) seleniumtransferase
MVPLEDYGLPHEMTMKESLDAGADIVLSSTDKLIGGPQGGLIVGRKDLLDTIRTTPLYRALRVGKLTLTALEATLRLFQAPDLLPQRHPTYAMLSRTPVDLEQAATELADAIGRARPDWDVSVARVGSFLGGGSLPGSELPSFAVRMSAHDETAEAISQRFRTAAVPVIPHIKDGAVHLNLRTLFPDDTDDVLKAVTG